MIIPPWCLIVGFVCAAVPDADALNDLPFLVDGEVAVAARDEKMT